MRRKSNLCLDLFTENLASLQEYQQRDFLHSGRREHQKMLQILQRAMRYELTGRQMECVRLYYFEEKKMREIAQELGIGVPAVSKHLKKARYRLSRVMAYAFQRLESCLED